MRSTILRCEYVVAHGISSMVEGKKAIIGSAHFVFEDEGCRIPEGEEEKFSTLPAEYSHLYLCIAGELAAVICIHDPLRREAKAAVRALHDCGIRQGRDDDRRQRAEPPQPWPRKSGWTRCYAEVLPEDKAAYIRSEKAAGRKVIMIGDGVNDSPALSEADAGIAIATGAAIAREIADITISSENLFELVTLAPPERGADGSHPPQLPLHRRLQLLAHRRSASPVYSRPLLPRCCIISPRLP